MFSQSALFRQSYWPPSADTLDRRIALDRRKRACASLTACQPTAKTVKRMDAMLSRLVLEKFGAVVLIVSMPVVALAQPSGVAWRTNFDQAKMEAAQTNRLLLLHFTTRTCGPCRALDQNVFSQPHVGPAIEQDFVPVRIDADDAPALAGKYRIDRVPTEIIASADGEPLANPPIPDKPDAYLAQLQNVARHFRQPSGAAGHGQPAPDVNPAYAGLPVTPQSSGAPAGQTPMASAPQVINNPAMQQTQQPQPQTQSNPFVNTAADAGRYGQAQSVYAAPPKQSLPVQPAVQPQEQTAYAQLPNALTNQTDATQMPGMPSNAMPRSYRNPLAEQAAATAVAAPVATAASAGVPPNSSTPGISVAPAMAAGAAATVAAAAPKRQKPELPTGSPALAFDGFCPVTLKTLNRWTEGDRQFGAVHRGRTYLFAGAEQRDQFLANPDGFSPVFAGLDPVLLIDKQQSVEGTRALGYRYGESFYLFSSEETKQKFAARPHEYAAGVRQAMNRIDGSNGGTVLR
jgi:protein disulfide-isomerase